MLTARPLLLLGGLLTLSLHCHAAPYSPAECCFDYVKGVLRLDYLLDFYPTARECYLPAIVLETKRGAKVCVNPEEQWVKRAVKILLKKKDLRAP
ncbi:unnamed protein product [Coccothraustes coccothraustes]